MNINRHGIPVAQSPRERSRPKVRPRPAIRTFEQDETAKRIFVSIVDGVEVVAEILHSSPIADVLLTDGWREVG